MVFLLGLLLSPLATLAFPFQMENGKESLKTLSVAGELTAQSHIVAVTNRNEGVLGGVNVEITPEGKGRVLINTNPFVEPDTQFSAETAVNVAEEYTQMSLNNKDVIITFDMDSNVVGGPSAGASMTLAVIAAIQGKKVHAEMVITGTIEPDGRIGPIGGVLEKAQAAAEKGMTIFLIPAGQGTLTYYERQITERQTAGGYTIRRASYVPKTINLATYAKEEFGLEVREVRTIQEAAQVMLGY